MSVQDFAKLAPKFGLKVDDYGREITLSGKRFTIIGIRPRASARPIEISRDGRNYAASITTVVTALGRTPPVGRPIATRQPKTSLDVSKLRPDLLAQFSSLCNQLSPENLSCDGELSRSRILARRAQINRTWKALEKLAGGTVTQEAVEDYEVAQYRRKAE